MGYQNFDLGELYRNQVVRCCRLMSKEDFEKLKCYFHCEFDPKTKASVSKTWGIDSFKEFNSTDDSLFKLCAKAEIERVNNRKGMIDLSIKY